MNLVKKIHDQFKADSNIRVLFFFDEKQEFVNEIEAMESSDFKIINAEKAHFKLKIDLEQKLSKEKVFLYFPYGKPVSKDEKKKFLLLDILIANKELLLDEVGDFMNEYQLLPTQESLVRTFIDELKFKKNQKVLLNYLTPSSFEDRHIVRGLISSYLEFPVVKEPSICLAKMMVWTLPEYDKKYAQFEKKIKLDYVNKLISKWFFDYFEIVIEKITKDDILSAISKLKYNLLTQHLTELSIEDPYKKLRPKDNFSMQRMNSLITEWENDPKLETEIDKVFSIQGAPIKEKRIVDIYSVESDYGFFTNELKILLLTESIKTISSLPEKTQNLIQTISANSSSNNDLNAYIKFLKACSDYFRKINSFKSYKLDSPEEYIQSYVNEFSMVDMYYRHVVLQFEIVKEKSIYEDQNVNALISSIHASYDRFLIELNNEWLACMKLFNYRFNEINVSKQTNFFKDEVSKSDQKVVVIISDALRYECGVELLKAMMLDTKGNAKIKHMMAGIPTVTHWGMANLLTDEKITLDKDKLRVEGILTDGTDNREKILKINEPTAKAVQYKELNSLDREKARKKYFNEKKIVYIYHNVIDATGDDPKTEMQTFSAVNDAIDDLNNLVTKVHASYAVGRVLVTSDHGFLFNYKKLPAASFQSAPKGNHVKQSNRYILTNDTKSVSNSIQFNLSDSSNIESDLKVVIPKAINRYKRQGSGAHFVHGGASLQEMIIPLIESTRKRKDIGEKVPLRLLNNDLKIVSGALKIKLYQEQPISDTFKPIEINIGLYNNLDDLISSEKSHQFDISSETASDREKEFILNLGSESAKESILTLKIFDKDDKDRLNPVMSRKVINNTFMELDF